METCISSGWTHQEETLDTQFPSSYEGCLILPWPDHPSDACFVREPTSSSREGRVMTTSRSHSQAERRRRERINAHLSTLRRLIPSASKLDKASLLSVVIDHVKDLKRKAFEMGEAFTIPTDVDEVTVEYDENGNNNNKKNKESIIIKASMCCDDRPELFTDLNQALHGLKLRTIRADVATLGGRVRNVLILCTTDSEEVVCLTSLKDSLKAVLGRVALSRTSSSSETNCNNKRLRVLPSFYVNKAYK